MRLSPCTFWSLLTAVSEVQRIIVLDCLFLRAGRGISVFLAHLIRSKFVATSDATTLPWISHSISQDRGLMNQMFSRVLCIMFSILYFFELCQF